MDTMNYPTTKGDVCMAAKKQPMNYMEELQKIDADIAVLDKRRKSILAKKRDEDSRALAEFLQHHGISAEDAVEMLTPVASAGMVDPKEV